MTTSSLRALLVLAASVLAGCGDVNRPIKVGVLHSLTGTMAISETSVRDSTILAIEEINQRGGLLGRTVIPIVVDGQSDWSRFAAASEQLITEDNVAVVFGCWTSASRKTVRPIFEHYKHLLFYPVQYEGLEESPSIVYIGAAPNQQIVPAIKWCFDQGWRRFFLVGSDYVFPRAANELIKVQVKALQGSIVGEEYILLGGKDVQQAVKGIAAGKPDVILNTINGDSNVAFFAALRAAGIRPDGVPTMSFSISEGELAQMDVRLMVGDYAAWNYFQTLPSLENQEFVARFRKRYGPERVTSDPVESAYSGVYLWAQAVAEAGTDDVQTVRHAVLGQTFLSPGGIITIDRGNRHTWKTVRIGRIRGDGQFDFVWSSERPIRPVPYPAYRSQQEWNNLLQSLYTKWGQRWANPG